MIIDDDSSRPLLVTAEDKDSRKKNEFWGKSFILKSGWD